MGSPLKIPSTYPNAWFYQSLLGVVIVDLYSAVIQWMTNQEIKKEFAAKSLTALQAPPPNHALYTKGPLIVGVVFLLIVLFQLYTNFKNFKLQPKKEYSFITKAMLFVLGLVAIHFLFILINSVLMQLLLGPDEVSGRL